MKFLLSTLIVFLIPFICLSQKQAPRFENDTVYTLCGYKIYVGSVLQFGRGSGDGGHFRFVKVYSSDHHILTNQKVLVKKIKGMNMSDIGNVYVHIIGDVLYRDGTTDRVNFALNFDKATDSYYGFAGE